MLILVMTLLSILFVIGVAFLASMSFEEDIIQAERRRARGDNSVSKLVEGFNELLREGLMAGSDEPFGSGSPKDSISGFAQLPLWHNITSPIEPYMREGGKITFRWYTDLRALHGGAFVGPNISPGVAFEIASSFRRQPESIKASQPGLYLDPGLRRGAGVTFLAQQTDKLPGFRPG